ncbi:hypothetical protein [Fictibacillus solisalsi]|uniref:hypothetical protein n=1 Tax=Fictibacillus solisalsi TaxID=459525 RepID=UPI00111333DF|nr:hypothetical protein [Fictibacillus solisalsi]
MGDSCRISGTGETKAGKGGVAFTPVEEAFTFTPVEEAFTFTPVEEAFTFTPVKKALHLRR